MQESTELSILALPYCPGSIIYDTLKIRFNLLKHPNHTKNEEINAV